MNKQKKPYVKPEICFENFRTGELTETSKSQSKNTSDVEYEVCVLCGATTNIPKSLPLDWRSGYIPGAGQLCHECAVQNMYEEKSAMRNGFVYSLPVYEKNGK